MILFGTEFWKKVLNFDALIEEGTISVKDLNLFRYTDDPAEALRSFSSSIETAGTDRAQAFFNKKAALAAFLLIIDSSL